MTNFAFEGEVEKVEKVFVFVVAVSKERLYKLKRERAEHCWRERVVKEPIMNFINMQVDLSTQERTFIAGFCRVKKKN